MTPMVPFGQESPPDWEALAHHFADELVERWHESDESVGDLSVFMGLTVREYAAWVECRFAELTSSLAARSAA